jgi:hypothetical protein
VSDVDHAFVDAEGARVLAQRIAAGPPAPLASGGGAAARRESRRAEPTEIVYLRPIATSKQNVRIYLRGLDGRLRPVSP